MSFYSMINKIDRNWNYYVCIIKIIISYLLLGEGVRFGDGEGVLEVLLLVCMKLNFLIRILVMSLLVLLVGWYLF